MTIIFPVKVYMAIHADLTTIHPKIFEPLMRIKFFFQFVLKRVFTTFLSDKLQHMYKECLETNRDPFVFDKIDIEKQFEIVPVYCVASTLYLSVLSRALFICHSINFYNLVGLK
jgi:hypothetical protein